MNKGKSILLAALLAAAIPALQGCFPVVATGVAVGVLAAADRRSLGTQTEDETIEWKASNRISERFKDRIHINVVSYNRRALITGEVPDEQVKAEIGDIVGKVENVQGVWNEVQVAPVTSYTSRSNDAYISSKVKARFVDANQFAANHVKVFTEAGTVFLLGLVNDREARAAVQVARTTDGVRKVVNVMEILPEAETRRLDQALAGRSSAQPAAAAESR